MTRIRRVKCDETRPACLKCKSTGRDCDGYQDLRQVSARFINTASSKAGDGRKTTTGCGAKEYIFSSASRLPSRSSNPSSPKRVLKYSTPSWSVSLPQNPFLDFSGSIQEHRSYDFFRSCAAPALSGYFDSKFWDQVLPRIAASEDSVKHAMIALASLYETCSDTDGYPGPLEQDFSLVQYNKAIKSLKYRCDTGDQAVESTLLTCILFICLEFMRGNPDTALNHLQSGLQILSTSWEASRLAFGQNPLTDMKKKPTSLDPQLIKEDLVQIFSRLSIQSSLCGRRPPQLYPKEGCVIIEDSESASTPFHTVGDARLSLDRLLILSLSPSDAEIGQSAITPDSLKADRDNLIAQLQFWNCRYGLLLSDSLQVLNPREIYGIRLLRTTCIIASIWNSTTLSGIETAFDNHLPQFEEIVTLVEILVGDMAPRTPDCSELDITIAKPSIIPHTSTSNFSSKSRPPSSHSSTTSPHSRSPSSKPQPPQNFTFEMGVIPSLYFTAIKCRNPVIRRKAIDLLTRTLPRREGLWDARMLANIARYVVEIEECNRLPTGEPGTWPTERERIHAIDFLEGAVVEKRVQPVRFIWRPGGSEGEWETWVQDIGY